MSRPERRRYTLADYTVELRDKGWYFGRPYQLSAEYLGPYASVASVTLVIARHLRREIERRHQAFLKSQRVNDNASPTAETQEVPF